LGIASCVQFLPYVRDTTMLYQAADVIVAPSRGPELGRPVLEACACGRAVVASGSVDGAGLVMPGQTGLLVPPASPMALADAIAQLLEDEALRKRLGDNARRLAEAEFGSRLHAERVTAVYERIFDGR